MMAVNKRADCQAWNLYIILLVLLCKLYGRQV